MVFDPSQGGQTYIEDCEVCCRPIEVCFGVEEDSAVLLSAERVL